MKLTNVDITEDMICVLGISISLVDLQQILSIILLSFNIVWLVVKFLVKFVRYYKNDGKIDNDEWNDLLNDEKEIDDKIKGGRDK